jgi:hypothetical protein
VPGRRSEGALRRYSDTPTDHLSIYNILQYTDALQFELIVLASASSHVGNATFSSALALSMPSIVVPLFPMRKLFLQYANRLKRALTVLSGCVNDHLEAVTVLPDVYSLEGGF